MCFLCFRCDGISTSDVFYGDNGSNRRLLLATSTCVRVHFGFRQVATDLIFNFFNPSLLVVLTDFYFIFTSSLAYFLIRLEAIGTTYKEYIRALSISKGAVHQWRSSTPVRWNAILARQQMTSLFCDSNLYFNFQKMEADFVEWIWLSNQSCKLFKIGLVHFRPWIDQVCTFNSSRWADIWKENGTLTLIFITE
jgi:hypothetical protein